MAAATDAATDTDTATQTQQSTTAAAADWRWLTVALQHPALCDKTVCQLLCVSKELRALLLRVCAGSLHVEYTSDDLACTESFARWLSRSSSLCAKHVSISLPGEPVAADEDAAADAEAAAVDAAHLAAAAGVLAHLPAHITSLQLSCDDWQRQLQQHPDLLASLPASLQQLRRLTLRSTNNATCCTPFFPILQGLPELTSLAVGRVISSSKLAALPAGLAWLDVGICSRGLQLSHLTALTSLTSEGRCAAEAAASNDSNSSSSPASSWSGLAVEVDSNVSLPASLHRLQVGECRSVQRLVGLTRLTALQLGASGLPARRLARLAACLTALAELRLSYQAGWDEAAAAWSSLPLRHLELQCGAWSDEPISPATLDQLATLTGLTHLAMQRLDRADASTLALAHMLQQLNQLRILKLWAIGAWPLRRPAPPPEAAGTTPSAAAVAAAAAAVAASQQENVSLTRAIAGLPLLGSLSLSLPVLGQAAAAELAGCGPGLTSLKLRACGLQDDTLRLLAGRLPGLRCLFLEYNTSLSDAVLGDLFGSSAAGSGSSSSSNGSSLCSHIMNGSDGRGSSSDVMKGGSSSSSSSRGLPQLIELDMRYCALSDAGRRFLATLSQLRALHV